MLIAARRLKMFAFLSVMGSLFFLFSCEDPNVLKANSTFIRGNLQTAFVDTFSVVSSTVQLDSLPSSANALLVGNYSDSFVGDISTSSFFQFGYTTFFAPDTTSIFDSIALILPYNKYWYGDTTQSQTISFHELTDQPVSYSLPKYSTEDHFSYFSTPNGFYNTSSTPFNPTPLLSLPVSFFPHRDSLFVKLPSAMGKQWFTLAQKGTTNYFNNVNNFYSLFFRGLHMVATPSTNACIVGFRSNKVKIRIYFRKLVEDSYAKASFDFPLAVTGYNNIKSNRSATALNGLLPRQAIASANTGNVSFIQSGTGLATKLEFPTVKSFFKDPRVVLLDAVLEVYPQQGTYLGNYQLPSVLSLYATDVSNVPLGPLAGSGASFSANVTYDKELEQETKYTFPIGSYLSSELLNTNTNKTVSPLIIAAPASNILTEVSRVVIKSNQLTTTQRTKLKIYYSYAPN